MKKILVLTQSYPSVQAIYQMAYVHSRNLQYQKLGISVEVLCFSAKKYYEYENIPVYPSNNKVDFSLYDAIVSHAPNLRNHYITIVKNYNRIKNIVLFFHGHEALILNKYYPKSYAWQKKQSIFSRISQKTYDFIKLKILSNLLKKEKIRAVYVSEWMWQEANKCFGVIPQKDHKNIIINNSINENFYDNHYSQKETLADFVTIRPLDNSKYAIDKVVALASNNPLFTFHIYGKGEYFKFNHQPNNVKVFNEFIEQKDIPTLLNKYRGVIMPTRLDAQGVMMCEMASYGIPTIISDLPVCREMLSDFPNCIFINNKDFENTDLSKYHLNPLNNFNIIDKFSPKILAKKELDFIFHTQPTKEL